MGARVDMRAAALVLCCGSVACGASPEPGAGGVAGAGTGSASSSAGALAMAGSTGAGSVSAAGSAASAAGTGGRSAGPIPMTMPDAMVTMPVTPDAGMTPAADAGVAECGICAAYAAPARSGEVAVAELSALSGLAVGRTQSGIVFAHNDHDRPAVYALDPQGALHARIDLQNAPSTDIEDIAAGPCGDYDCIYLGDIGDNAAARAEYALLRFIEPRVPDVASAETMIVSFERFRFTYEDGSHNAEGLMVGPEGDVYIVTKLAPGSGGSVPADGPSSVYRLRAPLSSAAVAVATKVATLPIPADGDLAASAAAAHPCGLGFLVRTYDRVYEFRTPAGAAFEAAFTATPTVVAMPDEPQSEGIDYREGGRGFITSGEGSRAPIFAAACQ